MPLLAEAMRDNPDPSPMARPFPLASQRAGVGQSLFVAGSIFILLMAVLAPFMGALASSILTGLNVARVLALREVVNLVAAVFEIGLLFLLTANPRINLTRSRNVVLVGLAVSLVGASTRMLLQFVVGLQSAELGQRWVALELSVSVTFTSLILTVLLLVAQRERLVNAQVVLRDEARRALEEDHESLRVRVFDHLHGTVQSELLVTRIRLLDIARDLNDEATSAAIIKEAGNLSRIHDLEIRRLAHVMVASGIDTSLTDALRQLALSCEGLCDVTIDIHEGFNELDTTLVGDSRATVRLAMFRIVEECVNNAIRHGMAQSVAIRISAERRARGHAVTIHVSNDGVMPAFESREGVGFRVLRARAAAFNGRVKTSIVGGIFVVETLLDTVD